MQSGPKAPSIAGADFADWAVRFSDVSVTVGLVVWPGAVRPPLPPSPPAWRRLTGTGAGTACIFIGYLQYTHTVLQYPELAKVRAPCPQGTIAELGPGTSR